MSILYQALRMLMGEGNAIRKPRSGDPRVDRIRQDISRSFVKKANGRWNGWVNGPELTWPYMQDQVLTTRTGKGRRENGLKIDYTPRDHKAERKERRERWRRVMS